MNTSTNPREMSTATSTDRLAHGGEFAVQVQQDRRRAQLAICMPKQRKRIIVGVRDTNPAVDQPAIFTWTLNDETTIELKVAPTSLHGWTGGTPAQYEAWKVAYTPPTFTRVMADGTREAVLASWTTRVRIPLTPRH